LAADHVCEREVDAMRQKVKAGVAVLCSEVGQVKKVAAIAARLTGER
jgi:hypothetical protein